MLDNLATGIEAQVAPAVQQKVLAAFAELKVPGDEYLLTVQHLFANDEDRRFQHLEHVLEHRSDPFPVLHRIERVLEAGGGVIEVANIR